MSLNNIRKSISSTGKICLGALLLTAHIQASAGEEKEKKTYRQEVVVDGLKSPWAMTFLANNEWLVTERLSGELRLIQNGKLHPDPIGGLPEISTKGQGGLLDVAAHPDYEKNGWIYISYASPKEEGEAGDGANTALLRARLKDHQLTDVQVLFKATPNRTSNPHFGGRIVLDKKGHVFLSIGDRGEMDKAQDLKTHQGRIIRLTEDGKVPKDNPFAGKKNALPEIWSYGHRNPQGLVLHPESGVLWEHEHGPQGGDELNVIEKAKNYGWPLITYGINYDNTVISKDTARAGLESPKTYWKPSIAPCGVAAVTSSKYPEWKGNLLVGSLKFNYIQHVRIDGRKVSGRETVLENIGRVRDIRQGPDEFIYVVVEGKAPEGGKIIRILPD
ncbi:PQQ-dependent sugar dehydrogenase [Ravibacter arvi]|uniref:PQQ-dependent sugar dehydrogenase n=1 Tax=Ravibacter arvi TaxID=2051041 RepID=A0ABP8LQR7_9BACT